MLLSHRAALFGFLTVVAIVSVAAVGQSPLAGQIDDREVEVEVDSTAVYAWASEGSLCRVPASVLSGIAEAVSNVEFLEGHAIDSDGNLQPPLYGVRGDGTQSGLATLVDTDDGTIDDDPDWDRPVGAFQMLPTSWANHGLDGNNDGVADPQNLWDAAASASNFLCAMGAGTDLDGAIRRYVGSEALAAEVFENLNDVVEVRGITQTKGRPTGPDEVVVLEADSPLIDSLATLSTTALFGETSALIAGTTGVAGLNQAGDLVVETLDPAQRGVVVRGDWDGDGLLENGLHTDAGLSRADGSSVSFGVAGDVAYVGDWNGDGELTPGIWRTGRQAARFIMIDGQGRPFGAQVRVADDSAVPLIGDWDGDGRDSVALRLYLGDESEITFFDHHGQQAKLTPLELDVGSTVVVTPPAHYEDFGIEPAETSELSFVPVDAGVDLDLVSVRGITVAASIAEDVAALLLAAEADGVPLNGWGWRSNERQIELRIQNCADPFATPSHQCSPPTATPGHSRHEFGLAIDFHIDGRAIGRGSVEFAWLSENAADFGLFNLASEPWHWSDNGS